MKYVGTKVLLALGLMSSTSFTGVYAQANEEATTCIKEVKESVQKNERSLELLSSHEVEYIKLQLGNFEKLPNDEQLKLFQILLTKGITKEEFEKTDPTHIC